MLRALVLVVMVTLSSAGLAQAAAVSLPVPGASEPAAMLAQYSSQDDDSKSNRRTTYRSNRGMGRLIGLGVVAVLGIGGWILRKMRGE